MKILLNAGYTPSLVNFRGPLIREMIRRGYEVTCCGPGGFPEKEEEIRSMGARFFATPVNRTGLGLGADFRYYQALKEIFITVKPDSVLSYTVKPVIYGSLAAKAAGVPKIFGMLTGLGYVFTGKPNWKKKILRFIVARLLSRAFRACHGFFFQNPDDLADIRKLGILPESLPITIVAGSGVNLSHYPSVPLPTVNRIHILMIARLLADKGVREFAEAAREILKEFKQVEFHFIGGFDPNPAAINPPEVESWVSDGILKYHGEQDDVRPFLHECQVYVLPSYREGTPRTVLEAMATGRPIITTDAPGCRETVKSPTTPDADGLRQGENGFLIPPRDARALATAMTHLIKNPDLRQSMASASRAYAEERFDVHKVNQQMLKVMDLP